MRIRSLLLASALAGLVASAPASALVYDAFSSFNGINGNVAGNFIYGEVNPASPATSGTFFSASSNCFIDGSICLQADTNHDVPGFAKGGTPAFQYGSVNVPTDRLLGHPDDDADLTYLAFVAPTADSYLLSATFNLQDVNPSGIAINLIQTTSGGLPLIFTPLADLGGPNSTATSYSFTRRVTLAQGEAIGFGVGNAGSYNNDSFGVNFSATVPEPATWAMMIGGMGLVGGALRRRRHVASVRFA